MVWSDNATWLWYFTSLSGESLITDLSIVWWGCWSTCGWKATGSPLGILRDSNSWKVQKFEHMSIHFLQLWSVTFWSWISVIFPYSRLGCTEYVFCEHCAFLTLVDWNSTWRQHGELRFPIDSIDPLFVDGFLHSLPCSMTPRAISIYQPIFHSCSMHIPWIFRSIPFLSP